MKKITLLLILLFVTAFFIRFYNFDQRVLYGPEQGISLLSAAENLNKFSLLGIPYLLRQTQSGLRIFTGPFFGYTLIPFIFAFNFDPIKITAIFAIVNLLTGLGVYFVAKRIFNKDAALFATTLFLFNDYMIYHSLFIWTSNYMPAIGLVTFYVFYKFYKDRKKTIWPIILGLLIGVGIGIQYFYLVVAFVVFLLLIKLSDKKFIHSLLFIGGALLGELPTVLFDLRHGLYHLKALSTYLLESLKNPGQSGLTYYHFLFLWPIVAIFFGVFLAKVFKGDKSLAVFVLAIYVGLNLISSRVSFTHPLGMPKDLFARDVLSAAEVIKKDNPDNFNVSVVGDFDNRGYILRYPLEFVYGLTPLPVEGYPTAGSIYVLAETNYDFTKPDIWELRSFLPYNISVVDNVSNNYAVYKLTK